MGIIGKPPYKLLVFAFLISLASAAQGVAPVLYFTDLIAGPNSGNSDTSLGQTAGTDGAIVTVWGKNLGSTQSGSQILVGGIQARIYTWGNAQLPNGPADLYTRHGMQMVAFQIPNGVPSGATTLQAAVGGASSNTLPFTVQTGKIYYVSTSGSDSTGNGSWSKPWAKLSSAVSHLFPGDILYACDGVKQITQDGEEAAMELEGSEPSSQWATQNAPKAMLAYPGASVTIGASGFRGWNTFISGSGNGSSAYWTIAKVNVTGPGDAAEYGPGFRLVGLHVTAPNGDGETGCIMGGDSTNLYVFGNEVTQCGYAGTSKLYHPVYIQSNEADSGPRLPDEPNREVAWNYLHDNYAYDGLNFYREGNSSAFMLNTRVHDNYVINQTGRGMLVGSYLVGPDNYFYNNVFIKAGQGPVSKYTNDPAWGYVCVDFSAGWSGYTGTTIIHFYNNTLYGCGFNDPANGIVGGMITYNSENPFTLDFRNNIVQATTFQYIGNQSSAFPANSGTRNVWFGQGAAPKMDASPITGDPLLLNPGAGDAHLQTGSPAIDAGSSAAPVPSMDFDSVSRPQGAGYDAGAFEFCSGSSCSPPPPPDTIPPTIAIASPVNGATLSGLATLSGTAADNVAVSNVAVSVDGGVFFPASGTTANWTYSLDTTQLSNAAHTITAKATDSSSNSTTAQVSVTISSNAGSTLPAPDLSALPVYEPLTGTFTLTYPAAGVAFNWTLAPSATVYNSRILRSALGATASQKTTGPTMSFSRFGGVSAGAYDLSVSAQDGLGNSSPASTKTITLVYGDLSNFRLYPNPWRSDKHAGKNVTFDQLALGSTVKIFTVSGHLVRSLDAPGGSASWDLTNNSGDMVASGVYVYLISAGDTGSSGNGSQVRGKLGVIK